MQPTDPLLDGRYELGEQIGAGGSARVYRAIDRRLDRVVAVKVLDEALAASADPAAKQRFENEARTAATFSHPNAVMVLDAGTDGQHLFMAMELVTGGSLAQRLATRGPLPGDEVARLGAQVAAALAAGHRVGIIHRDVKPSNILLDEDGNAKLADFGIARRFDEIEEALTSTGMVMGTRQYVSPEQAAGRDLGPATDVYSLGVVLFEAITGTRATPAAERTGTIGLDPRTVDPSIDADLAMAINAATALTLEARTTDASQFADQLLGDGGAASSTMATPTAVMPQGLAPTVRQPAESPSTTVQPGGTALLPVLPLMDEMSSERRRRRRRVGAATGAAVIALLVVVAGLIVANNQSATTTTEEVQEVPTSPDPDQNGGDPPSVDTTIADTAPTSNIPATTGSPAPSTAVPRAELIPGFPQPVDVDDFISLLEDRKDIAGDKAGELAKKLERLLQNSPGRDTADGDDRDMSKLLDDIDEWVDDDELDPAIATVARTYIKEMS